METVIQNLPDDPLQLKAMIASLHSEKQCLAAEKAHFEGRAQFLQEQLNILIAKRFGRSSEKSRWDHPNFAGELFDEAEQATSAESDASDEESPAESTTTVAAHERKKKGRKPFPAWLPREEVIHELPESDRVCGIDGHLLQEIGREKSEQLDFIPAKIRVIEHIRIKYGCPHCRSGVKTAPAPLRPFPKAMATAAMMAYIAVSKYADGLPLYRQSGILTRYGIGIDRGTLAGWMIRMGEVVQPIINLMEDFLLDYGIIQMDETPVQVLKEPGKEATSKSYMWVRRGGPPDKSVVLFDYDPGRGSEVPKRLLADYKGFLQTDAYSGYLAVVSSSKDIIHLGCMAHARRKFDEVLKSLGKNSREKAKTGLTGQALSRIGKLYRIEKELRENKATPKARYEARQARAKPIMDEMKTWLDNNLSKPPPKSTLGLAMKYLADEWSRLIRYLDDGRLEIDNNLVENAIRPFVIGRKGWLFSNSVRGVKSSANLYGLIETAKANGVEPFAYLQHLFTRLPAAQTVEDYDKLLPWNVDSSELSTA